MRLTVLLIIAVLLACPVPRVLAAEPSAGSLSGTVSDDTRTMTGKVDQQGYELISKWLRANPHRDLTLRLDSNGGLAKYGWMLHEEIQAHGHVSTDVGPSRPCLSACVLIWLAGQVRGLEDQAVLGFHSSFCTGPCGAGGVGLVNQLLLDNMARTEPALAVLISRTGVMIVGNRVLALARRENGHWLVRTVQVPTTVAQQ